MQSMVKPSPDELSESKLNEFDHLFKEQKRLLIILHNNPDPDAMAGAFALRYLVKERYHVSSDIAYGGMIGRAENRAMVRELKIPLKTVDRIHYNRYSCVALVDTQPGAGNNALSRDVSCQIVVDHHPRQKGLDAEIAFINPKIGAASTLMIELLHLSKLVIPANLATALVYAIRSETQELGREATNRDIKALLSIYPKASMKKLSRITFPKLPRSYFITFAQTMKQTRSFRNLISAHLKEIPTPEIVAEMADLLLRHERMSWSLCTGRYGGELILSLRASNPKANAGRIIKQLVPKQNDAGGHGLFAGGKIELQGRSEDQIIELESKIIKNFASIMGHKDAEWKPLIDGNNNHG
jgi:nanoRNase/pAp phosphatase (c-di-AMP/oligoRNAs hydrolase)